MSLPKISEEQAFQIASNVIYDRLGSTLGTGIPELGETMIENEVIPIWIIPIKADYPRYFENYSTKMTEHVILHLGKLTEIEIDARTGEDLTVPNRHTVNGSISDKLNNVRRDVEKILIKTASRQFAKLINVRYMLAPEMHYEYSKKIIGPYSKLNLSSTLMNSLYRLHELIMK